MDFFALVIAGFANYVAEDALLDGKDGMTPKAREILDDVDRALVLEPSNLGAHHLRLHLLEETKRAKDAISDAEADLLVPLVSDAVRAVDIERREIEIDLRFLGEVS